jgi:small subunit ribosomal protein S16
LFFAPAVYLSVKTCLGEKPVKDGYVGAKKTSTKEKKVFASKKVEEAPVEVAEEAPVEETPAEEVAEEAPVEEAPVEEAAEEAPVEEAPAEEVAEEKTKE